MSEHLPSGRRGQALAVGLTVVVLASLWVAVASPVLSLYKAREQRVADQRLVAAHMAAIAATVPQLLHAAAMARALAPPGQSLSLNASSDAVAGARLQQRMQDLAATAGLTLSSVETLPAEQQGNYRRISLRVTCAALWPKLIGLMQSLEGSSPRMLIDDLDLDASPDLSHPDGIAIDANFIVIAFRPGTAP